MATIEVLKTPDMAHKEEERKPESQFAIAISNALESKGWSIRDLADATESTYEHTRKLSRGEAFPSKYMLKLLCDKLGLKISEMEELLTADRIRHKYGTIPMRIAGKDPKFERLETKISRLNDNNVNNLEAMVDGLLRAQRAQDKK